LKEKTMPEKYSKDFGKKERVLNYSNQTYQLSRPPKVGEVMALIRECQPKSFEEWEEWYFENAYTQTKTPVKVTKEVLDELGERLYSKITEIVIPEWQEAFRQLTLEDCKEYIYNLTIHRTYDGYITEKSLVSDGLAKDFPDIRFEESDPQLDHAGDIDYLGWVNDEKAIGIQVKPITAQGYTGTLPLTERMKASFQDFTEKYFGKVFVLYSYKRKNQKNPEIRNREVIEEIQKEIKRLKTL